MDRREFIRQSFYLGAASLLAEKTTGVAGARLPHSTPNIILCMADDLGWGDTGYNGHSFLKTPNLDRMCAEGLRFERFYAGSAVCSPTRGSCLTGRNPQRYGIFHANVGHMQKEEVTLAEVLQKHGYATGHFGKWHLGTLTTEIKDSNRGRPGNTKHYSPPWENGFDVCFSTEAKVPTWDPMVIPKEFRDHESRHYGWKAVENPEAALSYGTYYWREDGRRVEQKLMGDDSRIIMDRAVEFIGEQCRTDKPFFAVIWFHAPHLPVVTGKKYRGLYPDRPLKEQLYFGTITTMDEQVGRLRKTLHEHGVADNTLLFFTSDNGPERGTPGSTGGLRDRKRSLHEGGIRVPGLLVWPEKIKSGSRTKAPACTSDYFPTVLDVLGVKMPPRDGEPVDGVSLLPLLDDLDYSRPEPIGFEFGDQTALIDNRYKLYCRKESCELYDIIKDPGEKKDLSAEKKRLFEQMKTTLERWRVTCQHSYKQYKE